MTKERQDLNTYNITDQGICENGAFYRSFFEDRDEGFFNGAQNSDVSTPLLDVPAGTFVKVYSGNTTVNVGFEDGLISLRNSNLDLSNSGDQVMVYTEECRMPIMIVIIQAVIWRLRLILLHQPVWITSGVPSVNTSYKPNTTAAFATNSNRGRSRVRNSNFEGDSAAILAQYLNTSNWQFQNNNGDYWRLKKILFNESNFDNGSFCIFFYFKFYI